MIKKNDKNKYDFSCGRSGTWIYSDIVKDHFLKPRNLLLNESKYEYDGEGQVGSMACGDVMKVWIKVNKKTNKIISCKWRTFGCASAIASTSMISVMATEKGGMDIYKAMKLKPEQIIERLGGLPDRKFHCSVLGQEALYIAIENYLKKTK
jgi:NifU-like protein involved in Fe-S cluster formation